MSSLNQSSGFSSTTDGASKCFRYISLRQCWRKFKEVAGARPVFSPSSVDVVTGRILDSQVSSILPLSPAAGSMEVVGGRYQSFSLFIQPIPTRFELDEMCNLWERDVTVSFDLHIGGPLLVPYIQGDTRGQVRSLTRQAISLTVGANCRKHEFFSAVARCRKRVNGGCIWFWINVGLISVHPQFFSIKQDSSIKRISVLLSGLMYSHCFHAWQQEHRRRPDAYVTVNQTDQIRRESFGARLLDPRHGDIIFRFPEIVQGNPEEKTLFASSDLLCRFSPYFKQCTLFHDLAKSSVAWRIFGKHATEFRIPSLIRQWSKYQYSRFEGKVPGNI